MRVFALQTIGMLALLCASSRVGGATADNLVSASSARDIMKGHTSRRVGEHLTADDTILDLLNHPAFVGFSRLLLPWDDRTYDNTMQLRNVDSLLPYHSHVDPRTVVNGLNHVIDDVSSGKPVFYDFYTTKEKQDDWGPRHGAEELRDSMPAARPEGEPTPGYTAKNLEDLPNVATLAGLGRL
jgi:hypothetical protein